MLRNTLLAAALALLALTPRIASAEDGDPYRIRVQLGLGAAAGNNVLPLPIGQAASALVERRYYGFEAGLQANPATLCESSQSGSDGGCGWLLVAEAGPRLSLPIGDHFVPYLSARLQWLRMTRASTNEIGTALRVGFACQWNRLGLFLEGGPTVLFGDNTEYPTVRRSALGSSGSSWSNRIVPMLVTGMRM
jgi:hypothetical protein